MASRRPGAAPFIALLLAPLRAQEPGDALPSLRDLLQTRVTVASRKSETTRESPGVVTLITREEIQATGARDLIDILRLVPGFDIGYDVQGVTGPAMRGLWGYEGKILLLWDGVEMNETLYGCLPLGNRFPVDQIRRVEIIRGPGSSIYGGCAEVAVIQITSLGADDLDGAGAGLTYGRGRGTTYHRTFQALGAWSGQEVKVSLGAFAGTGARSEGTYTDPVGTTYSLAGQSTLRPLFANLGLSAGGFEGRLIVDQYALEQRDNLGLATATPTSVRFDNTSLDLRYAWQAREDLVVTPFLGWTYQKPWWVDALDAGAFHYQATRVRAGLGVNWDLTPEMSLAAGAEGQRDSAEALPPAPSYFPNHGPSVSYRSEALYGQFQFQGPVNLTLGARWEHHSAVGSAFVPRIALTKASGLWHLKLLYAHAFRSPAILNINQTLDSSRPIEPEQTRTAEAEAGVQLGASLLTLNLFDTRIRKPLVYTVQGPLSGYLNQSRTGTRGFELEWKLRRTWGFLTTGYSYHQARNEVALWSAPGHDSNFLGFAPRKATLAAGLHLGDAWTLGGTLMHLGSRYAYDWDAAAGANRLARRAPDLLVGLNLAFTARGFTASLGLQDALDRQVPYIQPYNGGHSPLPGPGREGVIKLRYGF
ncbi:MAG TPA: TonB-dependent receptor [Holophagaceae bacterium]|nr:TonB-dependent receptor [Holophagaceae bacterium]